MTTPLPTSETQQPEGDVLLLRPAEALARVPAEGEGASTTVAVVSVPPTPTPEPVAPSAARQAVESTTMTWVLAGAAVLACIGWLVERRRRRLMLMEKDSVFWANVQPPGASIITTAGGLDDILPDSPDPAEAARTIYVHAIGETNSRREATLIDLHQLHAKLRRRRDRGDNVAAVLLLQQHLVDFRYTSPWVFLELLELYKLLDRLTEWDVAREAFKQRFGQNAPLWSNPSTEGAQLADDHQLCEELAQHWPYREARMFILRWMLGEPEMRQRCIGPPLLDLGVYRDLMLLDQVLDEVMVVRPKAADSLL